VSRCNTHTSSSGERAAFLHCILNVCCKRRSAQGTEALYCNGPLVRLDSHRSCYMKCYQHIININRKHQMHRIETSSDACSSHTLSQAHNCLNPAGHTCLTFHACDAHHNLTIVTDSCALDSDVLGSHATARREKKKGSACCRISLEAKNDLS
jgi:hypothetical protein